MDSFIEILNQKIDSQKEEVERLKKLIQIKSYKKGTILQEQGDLKTYICYVKKGLLRSYMMDSQGKEHIFMFAPEGWTITDGAEAEDPSEMYIDFLEDSTIELIDKKDFSDHIRPFLSNQNIDHTYSLLRRVAVLQKRVILLMSATGLERYEHFVETYPQMIQRVSQKMIASYLGITPQALSKAKGDKIRELSS